MEVPYRFQNAFKRVFLRMLRAHILEVGSHVTKFLHTQTKDLKNIIFLEVLRKLTGMPYKVVSKDEEPPSCEHPWKALALFLSSSKNSQFSKIPRSIMRV